MADVAVSNATVSPEPDAVLLIDVLALDGHSEGPSAFLDTPMLAAAATDSDVLYTAERDCAPPVRSYRRRFARWRFDRVTWQGPDLVTREVKRSIGHWNPMDQLEVFHCCQGLVLLIVAMPMAQADVSVVLCRPGSIVALAGGAWHSTHVVTPEARVTNTYLDSIDRARSEADVLPTKYGIRPPLGVTVIRTRDSGTALVNFSATPRRCALRAAPRAASLGVERLTDIGSDLSLLQAFEDRSQLASAQGSPASRTVWLAPYSCAPLTLPTS